jgi:hypothetical protein
MLGEKDVTPSGTVRRNQNQLSKDTEMEMWYLSGEMRVRLNKMEPAPMLEKCLSAEAVLPAFWSSPKDRGAGLDKDGRLQSLEKYRVSLFLRSGSTS